MSNDDVRRSRLPSGLRVVTESLPTARSVTIGAWVGSGARDEAPARHDALVAGMDRGRESTVEGQTASVTGPNGEVVLGGC